MAAAVWGRIQPYLLLALLAVPALWPLASPSLPRTNDGLTHLYRAVELEALLRAGVLFPRWAPDLVHGYGYPVFNYFPYLAHMLVVALHWLGLNFLGAYNAACGLALLASGWLAYRLGREHFGEHAGLIAGVAYLYSPYLLYDTYTRGSLPENLALALLPLVLLNLRRAAHGDGWAGALAAVSLTAALLAHHGVILQAMPFVVGYAVWQGRQATTDDRRRTTELHRAAAASGVPSRLAGAAPHNPLSATRFPLYTFVLALLLSAFFWLPALAEAGYAQIARGTGNGGMSYTDNFLSLAELLALPRLPVDPGLLNPPVVRSLPLAALALAALTGLRWLYQRFRAGSGLAYKPVQTRALAFLALAALTATLLIHPVARPVWDTLPLLRLTLFPWRLLGPTALFVALLAGALFVKAGAVDRVAGKAGTEGDDGLKTTVIRRAKRSSVVGSFVVALTLLVIAGLPFATPPREAAPPAPTLSDVARFEVPPDFIGTTTVGEYLPVWVRALPDTAPNRDQLLAGQPVQRHEAPGAAVTVTASRAGADAYQVDAPQPVTFRYRAFYFPGWRATLDGQPVPITITDPDGLMTVAVPAGTHTLSFSFGTTPVRVIGGVLSVLGLLGTAALLALSPAPAVQPAPRDRVQRAPAFGRQPAALVVFGVAAALAVGRPLLYDLGRTPLLQRGPRPQIVLDQDIATELTLLGADASAAALAADDTLRVDLYWQANHPLGIPYGFDVRLVDAAGHTWSQPEVARPRDWRFTPGTDFWPTDQYILDPYLLQPLPGTPPGQYSVRVNVFAWPSLQSVATHTVLDVAVTAPTRARACLAGPGAGGAPAWDGVELGAASFSSDRAVPGDDLVISLCWQVVGSSAEDAPHAALSAELRLLDGRGRVAAAQPFTPGSPYPASRWRPGDVLRDQVKVRLPAALETGAYTWTLVVNDSQPVTLGALAVTAPERSFSPPPVDVVLDAGLGPVSVYGLSGPRTGLTPGTNLNLTLVWRANAGLPESYHVFVHLLAPDGSLAAQSDGVPAGWTRRTTGWLPGEYVTDTRGLFLRPDLAPGTYTLWAGMYLPTTGERLPGEAFADGRVPLGEVSVE